MDSEHEAQDELVEIGGRRYRVHPAAVFPIMSGREFDELVEDVRVMPARAGRRHECQLVEGRNRVRACAAAGVVPEVRELDRGDPEEPGPECSESTPDPGAGTLFQGAEALERRDVVAPAHHELLDLAPVVRRPGGAVSMAARGPRPGLVLGGIGRISPLPRSGQVQPERPRGADPEVAPWCHVPGRERVVCSGVAQVLSVIVMLTQSVSSARRKYLCFSGLGSVALGIRVGTAVTFGTGG